MALCVVVGSEEGTLNVVCLSSEFKRLCLSRFVLIVIATAHCEALYLVFAIYSGVLNVVYVGKPIFSGLIKRGYAISSVCRQNSKKDKKTYKKC